MDSYNVEKNYLPEKPALKIGGKSLRAVSTTISRWRRTNRMRTALDNFPAERISLNRIIAALDKKSLERLSPHLEECIVRTGQYIRQSGDDIHCVYFPETAVLSEYQMLEDGKTIELAMIGREGVNGLAAVLGSPTTNSWTQALTGGSIVKIKTDVLKKEFGRGETLHKLFLEYVNDYVKQISQKVICGSHHLIEERLCSWLLTLRSRHCSDVLPITQEQIAYFLGVHRPSVTLVAQHLREIKAIDYVRGQIFILDCPQLERAACSCYAAIKSN